MKWRLACVSALMLASALVPSTAAQPGTQCDPGVQRAAAGPVPYRSLRPGYCEGTYAIEVGSPFQILSFTIGGLQFDPAASELILAAPLSPAGTALRIRARGVSGTFGYQMDVSITPPATFKWPTASALRPLRFRRSDFGVFGRRPSSTGEGLVPVMVGIGAVTRPLLMRLIAPEHLSGPIEYSLSRPGAPGAWKNVTAGSPNKGDVLDILLPAGSTDVPSTLRVRAKSRSLPVHPVTFTRTISN